MLGFVSCGDDTDIPPTGVPDGAEVASLGTYIGQWEKINTKTGKVDTFAGSIEVAPFMEENGEDNEVVVRNVNVLNVLEPEIKSLELKEQQSACNIVFNSDRTLNLWNYTKANPFGVTFTGSISQDGVLTLIYSVDVREGRGNNKTKFDLTFIGSKQ